MANQNITSFHPITMKLFILFIALFAALPAIAGPEGTRFESIQIATQYRPLTNAVIKSVSDKGITFLCDQGLIQVTFENLPPEFAQYRKQPSTKPNTVTPSKPAPPMAKAAPKQHPPAKSEVELAREAKKKADLKRTLLDKMTYYQRIVENYDRQSSFSKDVKLITTEEYNLAKAELADIKSKLAAMD